MGRLFAESAMLTRAVLGVAFLSQLSALWIVPVLAFRSPAIEEKEHSERLDQSS